MKHTFTWIMCIVFFSLLCLHCVNTSEKTTSSTSQSSPLFKLLSSQQTGVNFQNTLTEGLNTNVLMYEYFYNGGGVAAEDFNNDGLVDIYFTSNMGDNQLYLNKGDLQFENITATSGAAGRPGPWKTGVTAVDINGDRKMDIYVCYSGALPDAKRKNQLFINQGNNADSIPVFKEEAEKYGLASTAFSNQAYFFDCDRDGDLDMALLNHNPKSIPVLNEIKTAEFLNKDDPNIGVRLFRQTDGFFDDVTKEVGISGSALTYGLGLAVSDVNNDGWPDFYICNDYTVPDYLYINNGDGTYTDKLGECLNHNSLTSMGNDIADVNNDGYMDIISMDMLPEGNRRQKLLMSANNYEKYDLNVRSGFHHQFMRNMLQLNNGNGTFSEIGQLAGISNTDWSWAVLVADYDNDGWKDMYITNGYFRDYTNMDFITYMNNYVSKKVNLAREDVLELTKKMPASDVTNYMFSNNKGENFSNATTLWGLDRPSNSNGAAYADLDNDGDLDLIVNNINQDAFIYENQTHKNSERNFLQIKLQGEAQNTLGIGTKVTIHAGGKVQSLEQSNARGYLSAVSSVLHFGLGQETEVDSLIITWPDGARQKMITVKGNQLITLTQSDANLSDEPGHTDSFKPLFSEVASPISYQNPKIDERDFNRQHLLISELSFEGPCMATGDVNKDGFDDVIIGGARGQSASLYMGQENMKFKRQMISAFDADLQSEDVDIVIFDANDDDLPDVYIASGGYHQFAPDDPLLQDRLYLQNKNGSFIRSAGLPKMLSSKGCVAVADVNGDGFDDVFVGGRVIPGRYPEAPVSYLLINDGKGNFTDQTATLAPALQKLGMITDAIWVDVNRDDQNDLIVVGEWLPVSVFVNKNGKLESRTLDYFEKEYRGWWNAIEVADFNNDNQPDFIIGNAGTNIQFRASDDEPTEMYYSDFDSNGSVDPLFCYYIQGKSYPYITRDELTKQMTFLRSRFLSYESYAEAQIADIFNQEQLERAGYLSANHMKSSLFLSRPEGKYTCVELPRQAQYAPVHTITIFDYDGDKNEDVLLCGNNSHFKLSLGSVDANFGVLLKGDEKGGFQYVDQRASGFRLRGDVRSAVAVGDHLFFGVNQGSVVTYTRTREKNIFQ